MGAGVGVVVLVWLAALAVYDVRERRLPNYLTLTGAAVILAAAAISGRGVPAVAGAAALFGPYLVVHLVAPKAMGGGDVKLAIGVGALTGSFGIDVWSLAALGAPLLSAALALVALVRRAGPTVPHGPSMCTATALAVGLALLGQ
jgi:leader peptidase (prepilin peptidase)/N-methyltransferase